MNPAFNNRNRLRLDEPTHRFKLNALGLSAQLVHRGSTVADQSSTGGASWLYRPRTSSAVWIGRRGRFRCEAGPGVAEAVAVKTGRSFEVGEVADSAIGLLSKRAAGSRVVLSSPARRPNLRRLNNVGFAGFATDPCAACCWRSASSGVSTERFRLNIALPPQLARADSKTQGDSRECITFGKL